MDNIENKEDLTSKSTEGVQTSPVPCKRRGRPQKLASTVTLKMVCETLKETGGLILETMRKLDLSPRSFYNKWRYHPKVVKVLEESRRAGFDMVTDTLIKQALDGDVKAIGLYLKYNPIAKEANWVENQTLVLKGDKQLTPEEKKDLIGQLFG